MILEVVSDNQSSALILSTCCLTEVSVRHISRLFRSVADER